jgi:thymidylate synthase (FAD)
MKKKCLNIMLKVLKRTKMHELTGKEFSVLDKGLIKVISVMDSDSAVVQAARVSYGAGTKSVSADAKLINYLWKHQHTSPFEMPIIRLLVKAPIFVIRQWQRHRMGSYNEESARYSIVADEYYVPKVQDICAQHVTKKQCRGTVIDETKATEIVEIIRKSCAESMVNYLALLTAGVSRETARGVLSQSMYSTMYYQTDLSNLLKFIRLRDDEHAQFEIREYAHIILEEIVKHWVPSTYAAFKNYSA